MHVNPRLSSDSTRAWHTSQGPREERALSPAAILHALDCTRDIQSGTEESLSSNSSLLRIVPARSTRSPSSGSEDGQVVDQNGGGRGRAETSPVSLNSFPSPRSASTSSSPFSSSVDGLAELNLDAEIGDKAYKEIGKRLPRAQTSQSLNSKSLNPETN